MEIYVVRTGDTLSSIAAQSGVNVENLSQLNGIPLDTSLVPGQTVVIPIPSDTPKYPASVYGYAYPFINRYVLDYALPYMTYLAPFTYGITPSGGLVYLNDEELLSAAGDFGTGGIMHLSTLTESGGFDSALADTVINDMASREALIENVTDIITEKGYLALDIDFEFIPARNAAGYASLVSEFRTRLAPYGVFVIVALAPKTSDNQTGLLYEGHNYSLLGEAADFVLLMTYEWGYTYGPPGSVAPLPNVKRVVEYALTRIPPEKIYLGIPNYGYDWTLPYVSGESRAISISNVYAVELARRAGVDILYDEAAESPYFNYTDDAGRLHEVHFEDARSISAKLSLLSQYSLHGAGYWNLMRPFPQNYAVLDGMIDIRRI